MSEQKVERVAVSPTRLLDSLERARAALQAGDQQTARTEVEFAVHRLQLARAAQNLVLDEAARTPEQPAGGDAG